MLTRAEIVERARRHVGHREVSPNRSPLIDEWIRACGLDPAGGHPWCAAFASWCLGLVPGIAGALKLCAMFPEVSFPYPGDLMGFPTGGGRGHVGVVMEPPFDGTDPQVLIVEGNSDDGIRWTQRLRSEVKFYRTREIGPWHPPAPLVRVAKAGTR